MTSPRIVSNTICFALLVSFFVPTLSSTAASPGLSELDEIAWDGEKEALA